MSAVIINRPCQPQKLTGQCREPSERDTIMIRRHFRKEASFQLYQGRTTHVFSHPSRAASSPPLQPVLMLLQLAMCMLAGLRHLDLSLVSFCASHESQGWLDGLQSLPLCAFVYLIAVCYQIPLASFMGWFEGAHIWRYMKGQEVKNWVCQVGLHLKGGLTVIEAEVAFGFLTAL